MTFSVSELLKITTLIKTNPHLVPETREAPSVSEPNYNQKYFLEIANI